MMWRRLVGYRVVELRRRRWSVPSIARYFSVPQATILEVLKASRERSRIDRLFGPHPTITDVEAIELAESGRGGC